MSPSWYDLLDVAPDATVEEVRAAWKDRIAGLDPTDRRFRTANQAAEVLLDPQRRAAYDAELAAQADDEPDLHQDEPGLDAAPPATTDPTVAPGEVPPAVSLAKPVTPAQASQARAAAETAGDGGATGAAGSTTGRRSVPGWLLGALALLTAVAVGASAYLWFEKPSDASVEDSTHAAESAAERAVGPILSYDAAHLDEDQQAAESYMTSDYRKQYDQLFEVIKQNAPGTETVVKAEVVASGIVRSGEDRVGILLFVNRPTTNKQLKTPVVYKDQVTVTMQKVGSQWLVDDMVTSPVSP